MTDILYITTHYTDLKGAPLQSLYTSTARYVKDSPIMPRPDSSSTKEGLQRFFEREGGMENK